ncbi:MAG: ATP-dependent DNA helicase [Synergistaceae bacterium]|nr:ATP-dependent DNA helicase [Synergistaceae bacterium]
MLVPSMDSVFGPDGVLKGRFPGFEYREEQAELAEAVGEALSTDESFILAAEAPPGVGKTFALLAPAMLRAAATNETILFLTASIPLQEQLIIKDLPRLNSLLGLSLPFGLLKGKGNYACLSRAEEVYEGEDGRQGYLSQGDGGLASMEIAEWLSRTVTGDLSELPLSPDSPAVSRIAAFPRMCRGFRCPRRGECFVQRVLKAAKDWRVVVANYHLFFSYLLAAGKPFPVHYDILICDEAHRLSEAGRSSMTVSASDDDMARLLRARSFTEALADIEKGGRDIAPALSLSTEIREESARFFELLDALLPGRKEIITARNEELLQGQRILSGKVADLLAFLEPFLTGDEVLDGVDDGGQPAWLEECRRAKRSLAWCTEVTEYPSWAYWKSDRSLHSSPVSPGEELSAALLSSPAKKMIFISATLTIGERLDYWSRETGIVPDRLFVCGSPFELAEQMEIIVVDTGLDVMNPAYDGTICRVVEKLVEANGGATLVLLASHRLLRKVAGVLKGKKRGYRVLVQGEGPRSDLLEAFRDDPSSVLVGTASFREGVDIPGEGLTQVIIDRIPFPHPADPLVQARNALEGRESFARSTLPEAKMLLRQAAGRLIRSRDDRGKVAILDGRVLSKTEWRIPAALPKVKYRRLVVSS